MIRKLEMHACMITAENKHLNVLMDINQSPLQKSYKYNRLHSIIASMNAFNQ